MAVKWVIGLILFTALIAGFKEYGDMRANEVVKDYQLASAVANKKVASKLAADKLQKAVIRTELKAKKVMILKEMNIDESNKVDINSARYYLYTGRM